MINRGALRWVAGKVRILLKNGLKSSRTSFDAPIVADLSELDEKLPKTLFGAAAELG